MAKVYQQTSCEGCLPSCLLLLRQKRHGTTFSARDELRLLSSAMKTGIRNYTLSIAEAFSDYAKLKIEIYVDNKYFCKKLSLMCDSRFVKINGKKVGPLLLKNLLKRYRFIAVYLDSYFLHKDCHYPHWVVLARLDQKAVILDPWEGKRKFLKPRKVIDAIYSLKNYLGFYPLALVIS